MTKTCLVVGLQHTLYVDQKQEPERNIPLQNLSTENANESAHFM